MPADNGRDGRSGGLLTLHYALTGGSGDVGADTENFLASLQYRENVEKAVRVLRVLAAKFPSLEPGSNFELCPEDGCSALQAQQSRLESFTVRLKSNVEARRLWRALRSDPELSELPLSRAHLQGDAVAIYMATDRFAEENPGFSGTEYKAL
jgi:hypothetical protein